MERFTEQISNNWNDQSKLLSTLMEMVLEEQSLAIQIAQQEANLNAAFVSEKEDSYKSTDAIARARAKSLVGSSQTRYEHEFTILSQLIELVTLRISQLDQ